MSGSYKTNFHYLSSIQTYPTIPPEKIPSSESLKNTFERVIPYYEENIIPLLTSEKNILISAHGNSLRALCKKLLNISNNKIVDLEIPTGNPLFISFNDKNEITKCHYLDLERKKDLIVF